MCSFYYLLEDSSGIFLIFFTYSHCLVTYPPCRCSQINNLHTNSAQIPSRPRICCQGRTHEKQTTATVKTVRRHFPSTVRTAAAEPRNETLVKVELHQPLTLTSPHDHLLTLLEVAFSRDITIQKAAVYTPPSPPFPAPYPPSPSLPYKRKEE